MIVLPRHLAPALLTVLIGLPNGLHASEASQTVEVSVVWLDGEQEVGIMSTVYEVGAEDRVRTDKTGTVVLPVSSCNASVQIAAEPVVSLFEPSRRSCDGSPVKIEIRSLYAQTVPRILTDDATRGTIMAAGLGTELEALTKAYRGGEFAVVSQLAAEASFALRRSNPSIAQALSVISMDAGFRDIKFDPANPELPLIGYDPTQDLFVMTPEGAGTYDHILAEQGVSESARWTPKGIEALTTWEGEIDFNLKSDM